MKLWLYITSTHLHNTQFSHICTAPRSLVLGVFLVNVLVHMHLLVGGVGVHWYYIRSRDGAVLSCKRLLPEVKGTCNMQQSCCVTKI